MKLKFTLFAIVVMFMGFSVADGHASSGSLGLSENDQGNIVEFTVSANGFADVQGVSFTLTYDAAILANPQVKKGSFASGTFLEANTRVAGKVTVAMIQMTPLAGSGPVAIITFERKASGKAAVSWQSSIVPATGPEESASGTSASDGSQGDTTADTSASTGDTSTPELTGTESGTGAGTATRPATTSSSGYTEYGTSTVTGVGTGTAPPTPAPEASANPAETPGTGLEAEPTQAPPAAEEGPGGESSPVPPSAGAASPEMHASSKYVAYEGVLDRFKTFTGEKTPQAYTELFHKPVADTITQVPAICLADGKTVVKVLIELAAGEKNAPNFALRGASLKSLKKDAKHWVVEALPEAGRYDASLTVVSGERMVDYPLTVAPPLESPVDKKLLATATGFAQFISQRGSDKAPAFDVNNDGKRDYLDDYIFTANYLVLHGNGESRQQK